MKNLVIVAGLVAAMGSSVVIANPLVVEGAKLVGGGIIRGSSR